MTLAVDKKPQAGGPNALALHIDQLNYFDAVRITATVLKVDLVEVLHGVRDGKRMVTKSHVSTVRKLAVYLTHTEAGISKRALARALHLDHAMVVRICSSIEDCRDEEKFDGFMDVLSTQFRGRHA